MSLYIIEDGNFRFVVRANNWQEAEEKVINWANKNGKTLNICQIGVGACDYDDIIE